MKTKKEKNNLPVRSKNLTAGITLIALVVTIIVLIILAGVSINLILGDNGIITKAQQAKQAQEKADIIENLQIEIAAKEAEKLQNTNGITVEEIEGILSKYGTVNKEAEEIKSLTPTGKDYEISFKEIYGGSIGTDIPVIPEEPKISVSDLNPGDYIKYNTGKSEIGDNGVVLCRVLYNDDENGLQIITDKNITEKVDGVDTEIQVTLGVDDDYAASVESYNNAIETLNDEAEKYLNTAYAYDARCVGSATTVENGMFINKDKVKFAGTTEYVVPEEANYVTLGFTNESYIKSLDMDINYTDDQKAMQAEGVEIWTTGEDYWLASRDAILDSTFCDFCVCVVDPSGRLGSDGLCTVNKWDNADGISCESGLRPCFSLKSDIKIVGEDGKTADTAYVIE